MKLAVVGSRSFDNHELMDRILRRHDIELIITGGAIGADTLARQWAVNRVPVRIIAADWERHGRSAGIIRNTYIVDQSDKVVAFWDGKSPGTKSTISYARKKGKIVEVIEFRSGRRGQSVCKASADARTDGERVLPKTRD